MGSGRRGLEPHECHEHGREPVGQLHGPDDRRAARGRLDLSTYDLYFDGHLGRGANADAILTADLTCNSWTVTFGWQTGQGFGRTLQTGSHTLISTAGDTFSGDTVAVGTGGKVQIKGGCLWTGGDFTGQYTVEVAGGTLTAQFSGIGAAPKCTDALMVDAAGASVLVNRCYGWDMGATGSIQVSAGSFTVNPQVLPPSPPALTFTNSATTNISTFSGGTVDINYSGNKVELQTKVSQTGGTVKVEQGTDFKVGQSYSQSGGELAFYDSSTLGGTKLEVGTSGYTISGGTLDTYDLGYAYISGNVTQTGGLIDVGYDFSVAGESSGSALGEELYVSGNVSLSGGTLQLNVCGFTSNPDLTFSYCCLVSGGTTTIDNSNAKLKVTTSGSSVPSGYGFTGIVAGGGLSGTYGAGNVTWDTQVYTLSYDANDMWVTA